MFKNIFFAGIIFTALCVRLDAFGDDEELVLARQAIEFKEKGDYDSALRSLLDSLKIIDTKKDFDAEKKALLRQYLFVLVFEKVTSYDMETQPKETCAALDTWMKRSLKYSPSPSEAKKYNEQGDSFRGFAIFPTLLLFQSFCACEVSKKSVAIGYQTTALDYRSHLYSEYLVIFDQINAMIDQNVSLGCGGPVAAPDPFAVGAYVTNKGGFQDWIGVVVKSEKKTLDVRITYHRTDDGRVGQTMTFTRNEAQQLKAISVDALTKGWQ